MMSFALNAELCLFIEQAFQAGQNFHSNLEIEPETFSNHIFSVLKKHCGASEETAEVPAFFNRLQTTDLYLSIACAQGSDAAWRRFNAIYQRSIFETAFFICSHRDAADELASSVIGHLFLPDASGHHRIKSYDGQVSLMTWLRAIIGHKALDERRLKHNSFERLEFLPEIIDITSIEKVEQQVRANRYSASIIESLKESVWALREQERLFLFLHHQNGLSTTEIAELNHMSKSNVSYHLRQARAKLREEVTTILKNKYYLSEEAIKDCKEEIMENPAYSILALLQVD
jgi:RNA polymerase sigma-70 factor